MDRKRRHLETSCSAGSFSEERVGKPPKLDALVSPGTGDRVKIETSLNLKLLPPKDARYRGELA